MRPDTDQTSLNGILCNRCSREFWSGMEMKSIKGIFLNGIKYTQKVDSLTIQVDRS
jgi:hypothetical protein